MFSSSSISGPRRLDGSGAGRGTNDASQLRVMPTTGDPTDEVRASLATLTARAQRLVSEKDSEPLLRNGYGLYEASRKAAEEARQQATKCQSTSEGYAPATHASVELFMTQHLGFDAQAQQRLLQQLQHRHAQLGADLGPTDPMTAAEASGFTGVTDVDAVVAEIKNDILLDVQHAVHRRQTTLVRQQVDTLFKAAWHPYYVRVADDFETLSMGAAELAARTAGGGDRVNAGTARSLLDVLRSDSALAAELNTRISAFAATVEEAAPLQWVSRFAAFVTEASRDAADELTVLWATVAQLLEGLQRRGSSADTLAYVAASRRVLERKSLSRLLDRVLRMDPMRFEEVENMNAAHVLDVVARYCGTANRWMHTFVAMRAGRYDVAKLAAQAIGVSAVTEAVEKMAAAPPAERNALPPAMDLQPIYAEAATREDPYRRAVLLILLAGRTGESDAAVLREMLSLSQSITDSLEDALWLRLSCIRGVETSAKVSTIQSLRTLQRAVLDDMQELVTITQGSACRLASFLLHAFLPSTGLRLLLENTYTHVDGVHMALCFNAQNLLQGGLNSPLEAPIDLARHLSRYSSVVLLDVDRRTRSAAFAGSAMFAYFYKSGLTEAFVECCLKDTICARLIGPRTAVGGQDALLLRAGPSSLSEELLKALLQVAEAAAARSEVGKATHVLLAVTYLADQLHRVELQQRALLRAVQMISPAIAQVLHLPPQSSAVSDVLSQAAQLLQVVRADEAHHLHADALAQQDYQTFDLLCRVADVYAYGAQGNVSDAVDAFLQLPLVPAPHTATAADVEMYVKAYCSAPACVQLGISAVLPVAVEAAGQVLHHYARSRANGADVEERQAHLLQRMRSVCEWARLCCARTSVAYPTVAEDFERNYLR